MRQLIEKDRKIKVIPADITCANKGTIVDVDTKYFTIELEYEPKGIMRRNFCEFYTQTEHGILYFDSYAEEINGNTIKVVSPAKHRFLQRRQYRRIKYIHDLELSSNNGKHAITTLDISAGGMKFKTDSNVNIEDKYSIVLPLSEKQSVECFFIPIRIEKNETKGYTLSGRFEYKNNLDKMTITQYCTKRSIEIKNK